MTRPIRITLAPYIKSYPGFHFPVLKNHLAIVYRFWLLLRTADGQNSPNGQGIGKGYLTASELHPILRLLGLNEAHARTAREHQNASIFFTYHPKQHTYAYHSLLQVAIALGARPERPVALNMRRVASKESFCAELFLSRYAGKARTIARSKLKELSGVEGRTQQRWTRLYGQGVTITSNVGTCPADDYQRALPVICQPAQDETTAQAQDKGELSYVWRMGNNMYWRLPNTYQSTHTTLPKGSSRKVKQSTLGVEQTDDAYQPKIFYSTQRLPTHYQLVPTKTTCYLTDNVPTRTARKTREKTHLHTLLFGQKPVTPRAAGII